MPASYSENIPLLEKSIKYSFKRKTLIQEAITHKSFAHENPRESTLFNERLEFLGDAVLSLIISEYLFKEYPEYTESQLSRLRAYAVRESTLVEVARDLNLGTFLRLGRGEEISGGRGKSSILANAFEALIGAIYIDGGIKRAREFILKNLLDKIEEIIRKDLVFDYKSKLQEIAQAEFGVLPRYVINREEGPEHDKTFEVNVYIKNKLYGTGRGKSKKSAQQLAAKAGIKRLTKEIERGE